jgi:hypothetical protein
VVAALLSGCTPGTTNPNIVRGSGHVITEARQVSGLREVTLAISGDLIIAQGGTESLSIEGEDNIVPLITTEVAGNKLTIGVENSTSFSNSKPLRFYLSVRNIAYVRTAGSGDIQLSGFEGDKLRVETSGSGRVTVTGITAGVVSARTTGSGDIAISGEVESQAVTCSASGGYEGRDMQSKSAKVELSGSGDAVVRVSDTLDASVRGSGSIRFIGSPTVTTYDSGSGEVEQVR